MKSSSPSFSSTILDEINRSIDGCEPKREPEQRFYREASSKKLSDRGAQIAPQSTFFVETRRSGQANPMADAKRSYFSQELPRKPKYERGAKSTTLSSCFVSFRLKPVRTRVAPRRDERQPAPFVEQTESQEDQGGVFRSAASLIYANLKKVKQQAVSPGGRLVSFINSIFSTTPKSVKKSVPAEAIVERKFKLGQASSPTSAFSTVSSLSRPCLSNRSPSTRERFRSEAQRSVHFYPVSIIVDEDGRPCGYKCLHQEGGEKHSSSVSLSVPTGWQIGKSQPKKIDQDCSVNLKDLLMEKSRRFEDNAREWLRDYRENQKKGFELEGQCKEGVGEEDDDDGGASCLSSDLFELDLAAINDKYNAELPVYETSYVD